MCAHVCACVCVWVCVCGCGFGCCMCVCVGVCELLAAQYFNAFQVAPGQPQVLGSPFLAHIAIDTNPYLICGKLCSA